MNVHTSAEAGKGGVGMVGGGGGGMENGGKFGVVLGVVVGFPKLSEQKIQSKNQTC